MGKFLETKFSQQNVKVAKRRAANLGGKTPRRARKDQSNNAQPPRGSVEAEKTHVESWPASDYQDLRFEVGTNPTSDRKCIKLIKAEDCDLFADDDLKASYGQFTKHNLLLLIFDEIALEGLDGITLQALWKRIENVLKLEIVCQSLKDTIWQIICSNDQVKLFELPEERQNLVLPWSDPTDECNYFSDPRNTGNEIYKAEMGTKDCVAWGSCSTLKDRVDISEAARQMSLTAALTRYKNKLVLVADEALRKGLLLEDISDPNYELMPIEYCLLERIGRARELGEMTAGATALTTCFGLDQKSIHHYCKKLSKQSLVLRQHCSFSVNAEQTTRMGRLMHLRRFYRKKKSKQLIMTERAVNYLKKCTNFTATYASVKALFHPVQLGKLFKHSEFLKFINVNLHLPYKEYYQSSTYREYMTKSLSKERALQLAKLKDPFVNVAASWVDRPNAESSDDDDDDDDDEKEKGKSSPHKTRRIFNKDFIRDVYQYILSKGTTGVCVSDLNQVFDIDFPSMRSILKKLTIRQLIASRKVDEGRQTLNKFTATSLAKGQDQDVPRTPKPIQAGPSTALEKLMQRHKQKTESLPQSRVYTPAQFDAERRQSQALLPLTFSQPCIPCEFFTLHPENNVGSGPETNVFMVRLMQALQPFKLNVTLLKFSSLVAKYMELDSPRLKECRSELCYSKSKPDHIMKAYLLKALMDHVKLNDSDVIQFLDPEKPARKKRALTASDRVEESKAAAGIDIKVLGMYMGTNPSLLLIEKDARTGMLTEVYVSNPNDQYTTGDISQYKVDPSSMVTTERTLSRIAFILKTVQKDQIFEEVNKFLKLIYQDESKSGYDNRIDRKSLHKICKRLTDEGYLKAFTVYVTNGGVKKSQTYLCHPQITFEHHLLQDNLQQLKEKVCYDVNRTIKPKVCKPKVLKSPFAQDDVVSSLNQIKELIPLDTVKPSRSSAKGYGRRPKFACLALVHELLYYLIFEENNARPLSQAAAKEVLQANQIELTDLELENLPPMYCKEISWKTFIVPMPKHYGWEKGWGLLGDILMRFPLILITRCYSVTFHSNELQELLQHPIKRFYTLKDIPASVRMLILHRRKFIYDLDNHLSLLCYCGLVQRGPSSFHEKEKLFFYMNRKATLWDTTSIKSGYTRIEEKDYPKIRFEFRSMEDVLKYWSTMNSICLHTHLVATENSIVVGSSRSKPSLSKARSAKTKANVKEFDTGEIPGDHLGAAGLDLCLWSHLPRNWHFFAPKNEAGTVPESLNSLKLDKIDTRKPSNKHYLTRPRDSKHPSTSRKGSKQKKTKKTIQSKPVSRRNVQRGPKRVRFDGVDRAIIRKFGAVRYRPPWSQEEDKLLILFKIAIFFLTPGTINRIGYAVLRDLLHIGSAKSQDKTSRNVTNRYKLLNKKVRFLCNIENLIPNLYKLAPIAKYFVPLKNFLLHGVDTSGLNRKFKVSDQELRVAFIFLAYYILNHQREVEVTLHGRLTRTDYFNKENYDFYAPQIVSCEKVRRFYVPPTSEDDIVKGTLKATIQCALSHKTSTPDWSEQTYKVYQQFTQELLQSTLNDMKNQRMIQFKKEHRKLFFTPYRLSLPFVLSQSATFTYRTMDEAFVAFLGLQRHQSRVAPIHEAVEENKYGHMFGLNEVLSFSPCAMEFNFPEHHFALNPHLDDHSEVIEELAKRYQAKLKSELKDVEATVDASEKPEEDEDGDTEPTADSSEATADIEVTGLDEGEPSDLAITANDSATIDHLKHWISDCIDLDRVRSPSPELFNLSIKQEEEVGEKGAEQNSSPDKILSLAEIKEEMLKPFDEKRLVPHISDLTKLLSVTFDEITDDRANYLLKKHFVQQYPTLEGFKADGLEPLAQELEQQISSIKAKIQKAAHIGAATDRTEFEDVLLTKGIVGDVNVAWDVLGYIEAANVCGATGFDLNEAFSKEPIAAILNALTEHHFVLRTGICEVTFVHYKYQNPWLTNTFRISREQQDSKRPLSASIPNWFKVKALPWTTLDGSMDPDLMKMWLSQVFSYCIENPKIPMRKLCDKFCYLKPVDVFYLVEVLEEINALEIRRLKMHETHLFSEYTDVEDCKGSFLDRFEDLYIDCRNIGFISVGSLFHSLKQSTKSFDSTSQLIEPMEG